jgi:hypothetical protein
VSVLWIVWSLFGISGCLLIYRADERLLRRQRLLQSTYTERLMDGERFPVALTHYEGDEP